MPAYVALPRGINVVGRNLLAMSDLRGMLESMGFEKVRSLLQSGNLVFHGRQRATAGLEKLLVAETEKQLKATVDYCVRTAGEWSVVVERNPFPREAKRDPSHLLVMFMKSAPTPAAVKALQAAVRGPELVRGDERQLYLVYPAGIGNSKFSSNLIERMLGIRGTARNWNTVLKLAEMLRT